MTNNPVQQTYPTPASDQQLLDNGQGVIDPDVFFKMNAPPKNLADCEQKLEAFVEYHQQKKSRIVLITVITFHNIYVYICIYKDTYYSIYIKNK